MGSLFLQIGQCGNQIGLQLMDYLQDCEDTFVKRDDQNIVHSIMIDTEPKILKSVIENKKRYPFIDNKNVIYCQHGRGNNWALGYMDQLKIEKRKKERNFQQQLKSISLGKGNQSFFSVSQQIQQAQQVQTVQDLPPDAYFKENTQIIESCMQQIRKEIEKVDYFLGINMFSSLGGGTGSGLGSRLLEEFKEIFNDVPIVNTVVFPSTTGETTLQHYNCLLSLQNLQAYSDCIIYFQNDKVHNYLSYSKSQNIEKSVDITNMNQYIASHLKSLIQINDQPDYDRFYFDILMETASLDQYKFVELYSVPYMFDKSQSISQQATWQQYSESMCAQMNVADDKLSQQMTQENEFQQQQDQSQKAQKKFMVEPMQFSDKNKPDVCIQANTLFRGSQCQKQIQSQQTFKTIKSHLQQTLNPVKWNPDCLQFDYIDDTANQKKNLKGSRMMLSVVNRTSITKVLQQINDVGYRKFKANAFLHWYQKYNIDKSDFEDAFHTMDTIIENYNSLK